MSFLDFLQPKTQEQRCKECSNKMTDNVICLCTPEGKTDYSLVSKIGDIPSSNEIFWVKTVFPSSLYPSEAFIANCKEVVFLGKCTSTLFFYTYCCASSSFLYLQITNHL